MTLTGKHASDGERTIGRRFTDERGDEWGATVAGSGEDLNRPSRRNSGAEAEASTRAFGSERRPSEDHHSARGQRQPAGARVPEGAIPAEAQCLQRGRRSRSQYARQPHSRASRRLEIYLMNPDGTDARRLTTTAPDAASVFAILSPDGKKIVFDSNRFRLPPPAEPINTSDLFVMNTDGTEQTFLTRGSSATWSSEASTSRSMPRPRARGFRSRADPGAATTDSDIFVVNVDDFLEKGIYRRTSRTLRGISRTIRTGRPMERIVFTRHLVGDTPANA